MTDNDLVTRIDTTSKRWTDMGYGFYLGGDDLQTILITEAANDGDENTLDLCTACGEPCGECTLTDAHPIFKRTTETLVILKELSFTQFKEMFLTLIGEIRMRGGQIV